MYATTDTTHQAPRPRRYPSDMTDTEWALIQPLLPAPAAQTCSGGHPEKHPRRDIVDALRYLVDNGCKWRALPADFPPWKTVYGFFTRWGRDWVFHHLLRTLHQQVRRHLGRAAEPSAGVVDAQSVRAAETVTKPTRGYDAGKKVPGRKRHITVDTEGLLLGVMVTPADQPDSLAAYTLLRLLTKHHTRLRQLWADQGYTNTLARWAATTLAITLDIVRRPRRQRGFTVQPRRWVVERTFSWISQARRNVRDYERLPAHSENCILLSQITLMTRRLTQPHQT